MKLITLTSCFLLVFLSSCNFFNKKQEERKDHGKAALLASVNGTHLYFHQLPPYLRKYSGKDSAAIVSDYINSWIKDELLVQTAGQLINEEEPEIAEKVKKYKNYLLVSEFKRRYLAKRLDTIVAKEDLEKYYNRYTSEFILDTDVYFGTFIKVPVSVPGLKRIKEIIARPDKELNTFCAEYSTNFQINTWLNTSEIATVSVYSSEELSSAGTGTLLDKNDGEFIYLFYIKEKRRKGEKAPFEYAKNDIENIILKDRTNKIINNLEEEVYNDGRKTKSFEVF